MQQLAQYQGQTHEQISIRGGEYNSIFKSLEKVLARKSKFLRAIEYVVSNKKGNQIYDYRSIVDFLFCELIYTFRPSCFLYYDRTGEPLSEMLRSHPTYVEHFERLLLKALMIAFEMMNEELNDWVEFLKRVLSSPENSDDFSGGELGLRVA